MVTMIGIMAQDKIYRNIMLSSRFSSSEEGNKKDL